MPLAGTSATGGRSGHRAKGKQEAMQGQNRGRGRLSRSPREKRPEGGQQEGQTSTRHDQPEPNQGPRQDKTRQEGAKHAKTSTGKSRQEAHPTGQVMSGQDQRRGATGQACARPNANQPTGQRTRRQPEQRNAKGKAAEQPGGREKRGGGNPPPECVPGSNPAS